MSSKISRPWKHLLNVHGKKYHTWILGEEVCKITSETHHLAFILPFLLSVSQAANFPPPPKKNKLATKKTSYFSLCWLFTRDPCIGLLESPPNLGSIILPIKQPTHLAILRT